jgi:hypothetical protein
MKYPESVYKDYGKFLAQAVEIVKDKIGLYNQLIDPPARERLNKKGFQKFLDVVIVILKKGGWYVFMVIVGLLALGLYAFVSGMGTLLALNPLLAASLVVMGGGGIYLLWNNRDVLIAQERVGSRYKDDFDSICQEHTDFKDRVAPLEKLMRQCVRSLCTEVYNINSDAFVKKATEDE